MKLLRIVRSENKTDQIKFFQMSDSCTNKEFSLYMQQIFGNASTTNSIQILTTSSGKRVYFDELESNSTYFLTFEKRDIRALISWDNTQSDFTQLSTSRIKVLDESEYYSLKIKELKLTCKDKASSLLTKQEDSLMTLKQTLFQIHSDLGSQSLSLLNYSNSSKSILESFEKLAATLQNNLKELKQNNEDLRNIYREAPSPSLKRNLIDPKLFSYMRKYNYKDFPMNELTPAELRRFSKYSFVTENKIRGSQSSLQSRYRFN